MKKTKINLIISRDDYQKYEKYFYWLKIITYGLFGFFLLIFLIFFILIKVNSDNNDKLISQKSSLLKALSEKKGDEARIFYLQKKYDDLNNFLKDDAFSSSYYGLLSQALKQSSQSSTLKSFEINKNRQVGFSITFEEFPELMNFFKFIESEVFLKNFETISLKSFTIIGDNDNKENYELSFAGVFIKIKQNIINNETVQN